MTFRPDLIVAGFYKRRLVKGGIPVPVRFWFGQPIIGGERQDRSPRWCVLVNGKPDRWEKDDATGYACLVQLDAIDEWPECGGYPISEAEYRFLLGRIRWARDSAPWHPANRPREKIDLNKLPPRI